MNYINEKVVLEFYLKELDNDKINFLTGHHKERTKQKIEKLLEGQSIHSKIEAAKNLWKALFEAAMSYIDEDKRGYDNIFKYFDEFVNFEELIFASDSFYRDHTLHSLWVYFLGEYVYRNAEFKNILKNTEKLKKRFNRMVKEIDMNPINNNSCDELIKFIREMNDTLNKEESARCIAALCHDLGYPLKKIEKINKSIRGVLPYFSINNINEFRFKYTEVEQMYIQNFINILSKELGATSPGEEKESLDIGRRCLKLDNGDLDGIVFEEVNKLTEKEILILNEALKFQLRIVLSSRKYQAYSRNFEEYKHGIMSAFLLVKNLKAFENIDIKESNMEVGLRQVDYAKTCIKQEILIAMTEHTNDNYRIRDIENVSSILTFIDELEEFSRISRANKNREFVEEFCHTRLFMENDWFNVEFIFDNENLSNLDPERAFKGRCERFLKLFDIPNLSDNLKIRLKCIGKIQANQNEYMLEIARKYARITINGEEQFTPKYLKSSEYYSREEYEVM